MTDELESIRVFNPRVGTRDGLEFTATFNNNADRQCFISGSALAVLGGEAHASFENSFNEHFGRIAVAVSRKARTTPEDQEIVIHSDEVNPRD